MTATTVYFAVKVYTGHNMSRGPWMTVAITTDREKAFRIRMSREREGDYAKVYGADLDLVRAYLSVGNKLW